MDDYKNVIGSQRIHHLLDRFVKEVRLFVEGQTAHLQRLSQIGIALSAEKDINKLLEMIVDEAMIFTKADAGTLYVVDEEAHCLRFEILKNRTLNIHKGGASSEPVELPPVPLEIDGAPNLTNVSSQAALTGEIINIPDVYEAIGFDFTGPKKYDQQTGYRSKSMLVIPMRNHRNEIIGILQLLNAGDPVTGEVIPFPKEFENTIISLASQAAVALENARLIKELQELLDAFIRSIATAIDEKSPYTAGHIRRVTELTMMIAHKINETESGVYRDRIFSDDELEELRIAAWLHDVGKITTPEYVVDKAQKLQTIFDRIELVRTRFTLIRELKEKENLRARLQLLESGKATPAALDALKDQLQTELADLDADINFINTCNTASEFVSDEKLEKLKQIAQKTFSVNGETQPYLTEDELENLSIRRGTLTAAERKIIENHALVSIKILEKLPFPKKLSKVPEYAGGHHEKLDGSGYPFGLTAEQLSLQTRIMAVADIFEALTAKDRPYKKPMKLSTAISILEKMSDANHIDSNIYKLFIDSGLYLEYATRELNKEQIDVVKEDA